LEELEKLNDNYITSQQELEKLKLEVSISSMICVFLTDLFDLIDFSL